MRIEVARNENAPPEVLATLAKGESIGVRYLVAQNEKTPPKTLEELVDSKNNNMRFAPHPSEENKLIKSLSEEKLKEKLKEHKIEEPYDVLADATAEDMKVTLGLGYLDEEIKGNLDVHVAVGNE